MRWTLLAACAALVAGFWLPGEAAQPSPTATSAAADQPITFEQYRDWRVNFIERRRSELALQLEAKDLPADRKARLERVKGYYDWFAGLPDSDRDGRFRQRFERIDTDHDGTIDAAERAAWREHQRAVYRHDRTAPTRAAEAAAAH